MEIKRNVNLPMESCMHRLYAGAHACNLHATCMHAGAEVQVIEWVHGM